MDAENSERAGNNRDGGGGDSDTNNKEDLCLPSIEPFGSSQNLSSEADENTSLPLEKIAQTLSDDDFLDIDGFLRPVWEMPNPTLPIDDEPMSATVIPEICNSPKRKADTVDLNESGIVRIHGKAIFTSTSTCLIVLQNTHPEFSITPSNQPSDLAMGGTRTQISCRPGRTSSYQANRYWLFRD